MKLHQGGLLGGGPNELPMSQKTLDATEVALLSPFLPHLGMWLGIMPHVMCLTKRAYL